MCFCSAPFWRIKRVEPGRVRVEDAHGAPPSVPFWLGEAPGRTLGAFEAVSERPRRDRRASRCRGESVLTDDCGLDEAGAKQAIAYVRAGRGRCGALPTPERPWSPSDSSMKAAGCSWSSMRRSARASIGPGDLALRKRFCRSFNFELQAAATDNGINISLTEQHAFPLELVFEFLKPQTVEHVLTQAMLDAPMFTARWRWNASRALAILRFRGGRKVPPPIQRMRAEDLLASVFPDQVACAENLTGEIRIPDHPLVKETIDNCLHEAMDLDGLRRILEGMESGAIRKVAIDNAEPSPFSHEILNANPYAYLDDAPLEERRARAVQLRRTLRTDVAGWRRHSGSGGDRDSRGRSPGPTCAMPTNCTTPCSLDYPAAVEEWQEFFDAAQHHRARQRHRARREAILGRHGTAAPDGRCARRRCAAGWSRSGPSTAASSSGDAGLSAGRNRSRAAQAGIRRPGVARPFLLRNRRTAKREWCNRRMLARIHRLTLGQLAPRNRAGHRRTIPAIPVPLAAPGAGQPPARRGWHAADRQATAGLRDLGGGLGIGGSGAARGAL